MTPCIALEVPMALAEGQANRACAERVRRVRCVRGRKETAFLRCVPLGM